MKLIFKTLSTLSPREIIRLCNAFNGMFDTNLMSTGEIDMLHVPKRPFICIFLYCCCDEKYPSSHLKAVT